MKVRNIVSAAVAASLLIAAAGAFAGEKHKCAKGERWDKKTEQCVAKHKK